MTLLIVFAVGVLAIAALGLRAVLKGVLVMGALVVGVTVLLVHNDVTSTPPLLACGTGFAAEEHQQMQTAPGLSKAEVDALLGATDHCVPPGE